MRQIKLTLLVLAMICSCAMAQVKVYVRVQQEIYAGEAFRLEVVTENAKSAAEINPSELKDFNASFQGNSMSSSSSRIIINGRVVEDKSEYVSSWNLMVPTAGEYTIPSLTATLDNKQYKTEPVKLNVISPETTDLIGLEARVSATDCYVGQPIAFSVKWYIPSNLASFDFNIPDIMNEDMFHSGNLSPDDSGQTQKIEGSAIGDILISKTIGNYKGNQTNLVTFNKYIIPRKSGKLAIDPISVSCKLEVNSTSRRRNSFFDDPFRQREYKRYQASAEPITLNVKPLPIENKPADYYGLVGRNYFIMTELVNAPDEISVGTPLTLKISISGNGNMLDDVQMPDLTFMSGDFKIPTDHASGERTNDGLIFTQTIRPLHSTKNGLKEVPEISIPYFNYQSGKYDRAKSAPIAIEVQGARKILEADVTNNTGNNQQNTASELNKIEHKIAANHFGNELLVNTAFSVNKKIKSASSITALATPAIIVLICLIVATSGAASPQKRQARLAARALSKAIGNIGKLNTSEKEKYLAGLIDCLREYIADRFNLTAQSLTAQDCFDRLIAARISNEHAGRFKQILELGEHSRYAGAGGASDIPQSRQVIAMLKNIDKEMRK